ncbi:TPR-like protein [Rickenella mellea]|uniref:TPR-like protein n=1 Tax=Rickenella mellea TaxID=50990 RepID=A0A4Y7Q2T5_9AGAM|nr:TPR-like protein [Rickenella mellea]
MEEIEQTMLNDERAIQLTPDTHPMKPSLLNNLGSSLSTRSERFGELKDIEQAILSHQRAIQFTPDGHPDQPSHFSNLGNSLLKRFEQLGDIGDVEQAILNLEQAIQLTPDTHPNTPGHVHNLGISFSRRFECVGDLKDIDQAILIHQRAIRLTPDTHPNKPSLLNDLSLSFSSRFERLGEICDIKHAILNVENAVELTPDGHPDKPTYLNNLGISLSTRFDWLGELKDNEQAILNLERAIQLTPDIHPNKPGRLHNLGVSLSRRFERAGDLKDIDQAILNHERAVQLTPDGRPDKPNRFSNLGNSLLKRFEQLGEMHDMEQAILNLERAIQLTPDPHPNKPGHLHTLGTLLSRRFEHVGDLKDIEQAVLNHERAIQLTPDSHRDKPSRFSNLGNSLLKRFERLGEMHDMEQAILNLERAIQLTPEGHIDKPSHFSNLGNLFLTCFMRLGDTGDIEQAISFHERAILLTLDTHPDKPSRLNNLGIAFSTRFKCLGEMEDIEQAILNHEGAIKLTADTHTDQPTYLNNLGVSLSTRFEQLGDTMDIERAILNQERAVHLTPDGHSKKSGQLSNLGNSLLARLLRSGRYEDLMKSIDAYRTSAILPVGPPSTRLYAAEKWSWLASGELRRFHPTDLSALDAYRVAFELLPRVAWAGLSINSRNHEDLAASTLACNAAAIAIPENDTHLALEWLEHGRSIVWAKILQLRTPLDELRIDHPMVAAELTQISEQLERGALGDRFTTAHRNEEREGTAKKRLQLVRDWDRLMTLVRQKSGFERFLLPKQFSELRYASHDGPVVVLNVSEYGCDALIIEHSLSECLHHVHLEDFSYEKAENLRQSLHHILYHQRLLDRGYVNRKAEPVFTPRFRGDDAFRPILAELWKSVVDPVLGCLESLQIKSPISDGYFRITWCPTGPLAFLPIHAAGLYNADGTSTISLPDIAISSYTPTLTALLRNSQHATPDRSMFKLLAVIQPNTPGASSLPGILTELKIIRKYISNSRVQILQGRSATVSKVLSGMEECSWIHFACHGVEDVLHPSESGLLLQDGRLTLSNIIQKHRPHAEFAFLSACQTALGNETCPEEAVHLAAGLLHAGFRGVISTMWSVRDDDAPFVADKVYARLLDDGQPNGAKGAEALHLAVRQLREQPGGCKFSSWVPFFYTGV